MSNVMLRNVLGAIFRANPEYQLVLFDRLPTEQQNTLKDLAKDPDFYGLLLSDGTRGTKSVCRDTALLFFTLSQPGHLPTYVLTNFGEKSNQAIAELVLDGVLQIAVKDRFVCGSEAYDLIYDRRPAVKAAGRVAQLALAALQYAQDLDIDDSARLSGRLYFYNRLPLSDRWKKRFPTQEAVATYLGISADGDNRRLLEVHWTRNKPSPSSEGWFAWTARVDRPPVPEARQGFKLYVSPQPEFVGNVFRILIDVLAESPAIQFKVGYDASGLLRPDKMVIYFRDFPALQETANEIASRLAGCPAHGVPFTAAITDDCGLLSWGIDPPRELGSLAWQERESWRLWITNRLATSLIAAKKTPNPVLEPWEFALERLRLDKVDTETWTPLGSFGLPAPMEA